MSIAGNWNITLRTPVGSEDTVVVFRTDGTNLSGKVDSATGTDEFSDGVFAENRAQWSMKITKPMPMTLKFDALVDGDTITGKVILGSFGAGSINGKRA